nr:hypothetical protein Iba_chr03cCG5510 [Ipomoea batatas]
MSLGIYPARIQYMENIGIEVRNGEDYNVWIKAFNYINLLLNSSGPILGFSRWFCTGNGSEISFNIFSEEAIENLLFCTALCSLLYHFFWLLRDVHGSCPDISQLLADSLDIIVATYGGFNQGNLLHLIATVVLLEAGILNRINIGIAKLEFSGRATTILENQRRKEWLDIICMSGSEVGVLVLHKGFLISIIDDIKPFPFARVHRSCPEINQLLADSLGIIVPTDGGFNRGNLLHLIATVVLLGVITVRIVEFHLTDAFLVTPFEARGQCEVVIIAA